MLVQTYKLNKFQNYKARARLTSVSKYQTNIIRIVGTVPGAGKSTTLVKVVNEAVKLGWQRIIVLAKDNLAVQNLRNGFERLGIDWQKLGIEIQTLKSFKRNYKRFLKETPRYDVETGEIKDEVVSENYITCHSKKHFRDTYNVFIDEAGNVSDIEIKDLLDNWRINNLILCGDANQFKPIPGKDIEYFGEDIQEEWYDDGSLFTERGSTILLNKSFRSVDPKLTRAIENIKNARNILPTMNMLNNNEESEKYIEDESYNEFISNATHIAYTNKECQAVNKLLSKVNTDNGYYIVRFPDFEYGFMKNDRVKLTDKRFNDLKEKLFAKAFYYFKENFSLDDFDMEDVQREADNLWEEWKENHLDFAQAVTCHKMQGTTTDDNIIIHLEDFLINVTKALGEDLNEEEQAKQFQTFLYVAISRARRANQIWFDMDWNNDKLMKKYTKLVSLMKPMVDETIVQEDIVYEGPAGEEAVQAIIDCLRPDSECNVVLDGQEEYQARICKAHQHYTDADIELSIKLSFKKFKEATGLTSSRTFAKLRKLAKERNIRP